jgi:hypothetical protein
MGCSAFFFSNITPYYLYLSSGSHTPLQQAHASSVLCLSFRVVAQSSRDHDDPAAAAAPLLLASGGADHCVRMHSVALHE